MYTTVMMPSPVPGPSSPERLPPCLPRLPAMAFASSPYRPVRASPLSSPARATHTSIFDTQSSPISSASPLAPVSLNTASPSARPAGKLFRFAAQPARAVPRQQSRDAAQQTRRTLFLRNVRQRADDRNWERRNVADDLARMEFFSAEQDHRRALEAEFEALYGSQDVEFDLDDDADLASGPEVDRWPHSPYGTPMHGTHAAQRPYYDDAVIDDAELADLLALEEEAALQALQALPDAAPAPVQTQHALSRQPSTELFSDGDYDDIFAELAAEAEDTEMT